MVVVLLILAIIIGVGLYLMLLLFSNLKIRVAKLEISNILYPNITYDYQLNFGFYFLNTIKILGFNVNKAKIEKSKIVQKINIEEVEETIKLDKQLFIHLKGLKPNLQNLNLKLDIGTEDAVITSALTFIISTALSIGLPHVVKPKYYANIYYEINPLYQGKNLFNLSLNCIINVKMVHIMNIIYIYLQKRREEKYERTSNRRAYAHSYE